MGKRTLLSTIMAITYFVVAVHGAHAQEKASGSSAVLLDVRTPKPTDNRAKILQAYLEAQHSPLASYATDFVQAADENNLDWRLLACISGVESTFGQALPAGSNNAWGWGIYGDHMTTFPTYTDAITTISKALRQNYINALGTDDVYAIGSRYAASTTWAVRVEKYMAAIDQFALTHQHTTLPLSL